MQQIIFIHGGDTFDTHAEFMTALSSYAVDPYAQKKKWRASLQSDLQQTHTVMLPEMPNKQNARYDAWKLWFEKYVPYLKEGDILLGHSLGAVFLTKYLSEEELPMTLKALYLIAAPFFSEDSKEGGDFRFKADLLPQILKKCENIVLYHAEDDPVVPFADLKRFAEHLPGARTVVFKDRGHFLQESFPELLEDLKSL